MASWPVQCIRKLYSASSSSSSDGITGFSTQLYLVTYLHCLLTTNLKLRLTKFGKQARINFANSTIYVYTDSNFIRGTFPKFLDTRYFSITIQKSALDDFRCSGRITIAYRELS